MKQKIIIQKVVLAAVIMKDNKVLILQRSKDEDVYPNIWELPSGKKEPLEKCEDSLLREVKEETGLNVKIIIPFSVFNYQIKRRGEIRDSTQINFLAKVKGKDNLKLSSEHQSFAWINKNEIDRYKLTEKTKKVIKEAFKLLSLMTK